VKNITSSASRKTRPLAKASRTVGRVEERFGNESRQIDTATRGSHCHFHSMAAGVRDLKVWQEAVALGGEVLRVIRHSARRETKSATDAVIITAFAIASHVAEGYGRYTAPEQRQLYRAAKRDLLRLETQLAILRHADLLSIAAHGELLKRTHHVGRLLAGYMVYLERQRVSEDENVAAQTPLPAKATTSSASS
jgi:four helix bundle protein